LDPIIQDTNRQIFYYVFKGQQRKTFKQQRMNVAHQIKNCIDSQPEPKQKDMQTIHALILRVMPDSRLWFSDGLNPEGKPIANPTIGYGLHIMQYANGKTKDVFQIGMSANTTGISIHILGISDKTYLIKNFGTTLGKASITGYCVKFKSLQDLDMTIFEQLIRYGFAPKS